MKEIEAKILEIDPEGLREKLEKIGASKVFEEQVRSEFYHFDDGRIEEIKLLQKSSLLFSAISETSRLLLDSLLEASG